MLQYFSAPATMSLQIQLADSWELKLFICHILDNLSRWDVLPVLVDFFF